MPTLTIPRVLTLMAVLLAIVGFAHKLSWADLSWGQAIAEGFKIAVLAVIHACFSYRLTQGVHTCIDLASVQGPHTSKALNTAMALTAFYFCVDVWLVHTGLGWVTNWPEWALWIGGVGFTLVNLAGDWIEQRLAGAREILATTDQASQLSAKVVQLQRKVG